MQTVSEWQAQQKWNYMGAYKKRKVLKKIGRSYQYAIIVWGKLPGHIRAALFEEYKRSCFDIKTNAQQKAA